MKNRHSKIASVALPTQTRRQSRRRILGTSAAALLAISMMGSSAFAAADTWTGVSAVANTWDQATNWSGGVPISTSQLFFPNPAPGLAATTITLSAGEVADSLNFSSPGAGATNYTLSGGTLTLTTGNVEVFNGAIATINSVLDGGAASNLTLVAGTTGTLVLNANNTYTGATTVNAGTLTVGDAAHAGASITAGGANVVTVNAGTLGGFGTINGSVILNNGGIINLGSTGHITGVLVVNTPTGGSWNGTGTVTGDVTVTSTAQLTMGTGSQLNSAGTVNLINTSTLVGSGVVNSSAVNANVNDAGLGNFTYNGQIIGAHTLVVNNASVGSFAQMDLSGTNTYTGTTTITGALGLTAGGTLGTGNVLVNANSSLFLNASTAPVTANITINGTGTTNFSGAGPLGAGAIFAEAGAANAITGTITLGSSSTIAVFGAGGPVLALNGAIGTNVAGSTLTLASDFGTSGGVINVAGSIGGTGSSTSMNVVVDSTTVNETAAAGNVYNGTTTIRSTITAGTGILNATAANTLPIANGRSAVTMDDSGLGSSTLGLGANQAIASLTGATTSSVTLGANTLTIGNSLGGPTTTYAGTTGSGIAAASGGISGTGNLVKDGTSTESFTGVNTYTGTTTIGTAATAGGVLLVSGSTNGANQSSLGLGANNAATGTTVDGTAGSSTLQLAPGTAITTENLILKNGGKLLLGNGATWGGPGTGTITVTGVAMNNTIDDLGGKSTINSNIDKSNSNLIFTDSTNSAPGVASITMNGSITSNTATPGSYNSDLFVTGTTVNLNAANTYLGPTHITSTNAGGGNGILNANVPNALPTAAGRSEIFMDESVNNGPLVGTGGSTLNIGPTTNGGVGGAATVGANQSVASLVGGATSKITLGANTLTIGFGTGLDTNGIAGAVFAGVISGNGGIFKDETSTQILTGTNTYFGQTRVNGGTLQIGDGNTAGSSIANSVPVIVDITATLAVDLTTGSSFTNNVTDNGTIHSLAGTTGNDLTQTFSGQLTGTGNLVADVAGGNTIVTNVNGYQGGTIINNGSMVQVGTGTTAATAGSLGSGAVKVENASTLLLINVSGGILANDITNSVGGVSTIADGFPLAAPVAATSSATTITLTGAITNGAAGTIQVFANSPTGTLVLANAGNTYTGTGGVSTQVFNGGTLQIGTAAQAGSVGLNTAANTVDVDTGGTLVLVNIGTTLPFNTFAINVDNSIAGANTGTFNVSSANNNNLTGVLSNSGGGGATLNLIQSGTGTTYLTGTNTYSGTTTISAGTLQLGDNTAGGSATGTLGDGTGAVTDNATLSFNRSNALTVANAISGTGAVNQIGNGVTTLTGANTYSGTTTITAGTLDIGGGGGTGTLGTGLVVDNSILTFDRTGTLPVTNTITGTGAVIQKGTGKTVFSGTGTYSGTTTINAGTLQVDGTITASAVTVNTGGILSGTGTILQSVTVNTGGHLAPGDNPPPAGITPGTITVGTLTLNTGAILDYDLSTPGMVGGGVNDLTNVTGNLTVVGAGTLNVNALPGFGDGAYRLINYGGALAGNFTGEIINGLPAGDTATITTNIPGQVNLIVLGPAVFTGLFQYWDGTNFAPTGVPFGNGGSGTWNNFATNWTNAAGTANAAWQSGKAFFETVGGTVTLGDNVNFQAMEFTVDGYIINGAGFTLSAENNAPGGLSNIAVDFAGQTATINAQIMNSALGAATLQKTGAGTLVLTNATNSYSGGTEIDGGTVSVATPGALGTGNITFKGIGELLTTATGFTTAKTITIGGGFIGRLSNSVTGAANNATYTGTLTLGASSQLHIGSAGNTGIVTLAPTAVALGATDAVVVDFGTLQNGGGAFNTLTGTAGVTTTVNAAGTLDANGNATHVSNLLGSGILTNSGAATAYTIDSGTFTGVIKDGANVGGISLIKNTAGLLTLGGLNTYTGTTTVNAGTLQAGINQVGTAGAFGNGSAVTVQGTGILDLAGKTATIGSLSDGGVATGTVTSSAAGGILTILTQTNAVVPAATTTQFSGPITGTLALVIGNAAGGAQGTQSISGAANTYTGGTTVLSGATLDIDSGTAGVTTPLGTGTLTINAPGTAGAIIGTSLGGAGTQSTIANAVTVNGSFAVTNIFPLVAGVPVVEGPYAFGAAGFRSAGVVFNGVVNLASAGVTTITTNSGFLDFTNQITGAGSGGLTFAGHTSTFINGAVSNTYTGVTTVGDALGGVTGTNYVLLGKTGGTLAIPGNLVITPNGYVQFDAGTAGVGSNQIATNANVVVNGTLDTAGLNQTVNQLTGAGTIRLDSSTYNSTFVPLAVVRGGVLTVNSGFFTGSIVDNGLGGQLVKNSTGTLILTGINPYVGNTTINGGILQVDGSIGSKNTLVNPAGQLQGIGVIGGNLVNNGTVKPGDSPGTLSVKGNYTQGAGGNLRIELASTTSYGRLQVGGKASLNGTLTAVSDGGFTPKAGNTFTILTAAGGVTGKFNTFNNQTGAQNSTLLKFEIEYDPNDVKLEFVQSGFLQGLKFEGLTPNQQAVASELDHVLFDKRMGDIIAFLDKLPLSAIPNALDQIAPEELASIYNTGVALANVQSINLQRRTADLRAGSSGFSASGFHMAGSGPDYSGSMSLGGAAGPSGPDGKEVKETKQVMPEEPKFGVFLTGVGEWVNVGSTFNSRGYDLDSGGFTLGLDYKLTPTLAIGLNAGYAHTNGDLNNGGRLDVDGGTVGLYATYFPSDFYIDTAVTGGYNSYSTKRAGLAGSTFGETDGGSLNVLFGTGYMVHAGGLTVGPTGTFQYTYMGVNEFTEHGSLAPLNIPGQNQESIRTAFGAKASYDWKAGGVVIRPELSLAWQHEYADAAYEIDGRFANGAGGVFAVHGPSVGRDSLLLGAGVAVQWSERLSTYVYYDGEFGRTNYQDSNVSGGFRVSF